MYLTFPRKRHFDFSFMSNQKEIALFKKCKMKYDYVCHENGKFNWKLVNKSIFRLININIRVLSLYPTVHENFVLCLEYERFFNLSHNVHLGRISSFLIYLRSHTIK